MSCFFFLSEVELKLWEQQFFSKSHSDLFCMTWDLKITLQAQVKCCQIRNLKPYQVVAICVLEPRPYFWILKMIPVCTRMNTITVVHRASHQQRCITTLASLLFSSSFHPSLVSPLTQLFLKETPLLWRRGRIFHYSTARREREGDDRGLNKWAIVFRPFLYGPQVIVLG